jgi:exonuclease III
MSGKDMLKILTWNIKQGGGNRIKQQIDVIENQNADIVALQEINDNNRYKYREYLFSNGYDHIIDSFEIVYDANILTESRKYGQIIASKYSLETLSHTSIDVPFPERITICNISVNSTTFTFMTIHIPPGSSNGWYKIETFEGIYQYIQKNKLFPLILCGDFNTPKQEMDDGTVITWGQKIKKNYRIVTDKSRGPRWDRGERMILRGLENFGIVDVYRYLNGYILNEYSWYWKGKGKEVGRRYDHFFASKILEPISCFYLHEYREQGLSDHSPMIAVFSI